MWIAKFKLNGEFGLIGSRTKKFEVNVLEYPVHIYENKKYLCVFLVGFIFGNEENKNRFVEDLKKSERVVNIERQESSIIFQIKENSRFVFAYKHNLIHIEPILVDDEGYEVWTVGSWSKKNLIDFIEVLEDSFDIELLMIKNKKIANVSVISIHPGLTLNQKKAIQIAIKNGYYEYPRKIDLKKLAELIGVSYSTYQAHLRKAEQKLMPFLYYRAENGFGSNC